VREAAGPERQGGQGDDLVGRRPGLVLHGGHVDEVPAGLPKIARRIEGQLHRRLEAVDHLVRPEHPGVFKVLIKAAN